MFTKIAVILSATFVSYTEAARCEYEAYTGKIGTEWSAHLNGEYKPDILSPKKESILATKYKNEIAVKLVSKKPTLELIEVSLETKNAMSVMVKGLGQAKKVKGSTGKWSTTTYKGRGSKMDEVIIMVTSVMGESAIRNVFVTACVEPPKSDLEKEFQQSLNDFSDLWNDVEIDKMVNNWYTDEVILMFNEVPLLRAKDNKENLKCWTERYPLSSRNLVKVVQMSEIRIYTIHGETYYKDKAKTKIESSSKLLIIWKLERGVWLIDVVSFTYGGP